MVISAVIILVGGVLAVWYSETRLGLSRDWVFFGLAASGYTLMTFYLLNKIRPLRRPFRVARMLAAAIVTEVPVVALWVLFYANILTLPESMLPYTVGGIVVAPAVVILIESFVMDERKG